MKFSLLALCAGTTTASAVEDIGYYSWNWGSGSSGPPGSTVGIAFTGLISVKDAIAGYSEGASWCCPSLGDNKYITLGGGNAAGMFSVDALQQITADMQLIIDAGYSGIVYDVEETVGSSLDLITAFKKSFSAAKQLGLATVVTTSHSAPYQTSSPQDAVDLVSSWVLDNNLDVISPQLYSSGLETAPELDATASCASIGCTWDLYRGAVNKFVPSIVDETQYAAVQDWASSIGLVTDGYYIWKQE
jgi:hypothetical protein